MIKVYFYPNVRANVSFGGYSISGFLAKALMIQRAMSAASDTFANPPTSMEDLLALITAYQGSMADADTKDQNEIKLRNDNRKALTNDLIGNGNYVSGVASGNSAIILLSGYDVRKPNERSAPLQKPQNPRAADGVNSGEAVIAVDAVADAKSYGYHYKDIAVVTEGGWTTIPATTCSSTIKQLIKGVTYLFYVSAVGPRGQVTFSETISFLVR